MSSIVTYQLQGPVAVITMDDGKVNAISPAMLRELNAALDRAELNRAVVVLTGREGVFSAGFDLRVLRSGQVDAIGMVRGGFTLAARLLAHPRPVVIACTGHAMAMGAFLMLAGDYRFAADGPFKHVVNEVAIGITMPRAAIELCRQRLTPAHFHRAVFLSETYAPHAAAEAGFVDRVVPTGEVIGEAIAYAHELTKLDAQAHAATKHRARRDSIRAIHRAIRWDTIDLLALGLSHLSGKIRRDPKATKTV